MSRFAASEIGIARLARQLVEELVIDRDRDLARALTRVLRPGRDRIAELSRDLERVREVRIAGQITRARGLAAEALVCQMAVERISTQAIGSAQKVDTARERVSPLAARATGVAARLLPSADRLRYAEEYRSELYELAEASRRAQWGYAVRLVVCALPLRHELSRELRRDAREAVSRP